jgi:ferredoxin-NADP reductase/energy-converting hydrogenase Eha subunit C
MNTLNLWIRRFWAPFDKQLDRLTSYRLVLYFLFVLLGWAIAGSLLDKLAFHWYDILISALVLLTACLGSNYYISKYLNIAKNNESDYISALILTLILTPTHSFSGLIIIAIAGVIAMLSKYILVISKWHIFNPAAFGAFISAEIFHHYASWWIGTSFMTPVVIIGGMLVLRKMKRFIMVATFEIVALLAIATQTYLNQSASAVGHNLWIAIISTPLLFLGYIMLTEPQTSPRYLKNYLPYAVLVGFIYGYAKLGISPEESLLIGNIFAYVIEPNRRVELNFVRKIKEASGIESFIFSGKRNFKYAAGQYMEWTLQDNKPDLRGNRRYLTVSSSPTEPDLMFTLRIPEKMSKFKQNLENFKKGDKILASQLAGEFVLPKGEKQKLAFLAGGVGITPFRSMIKYASDFGHERDIRLLYSANSEEEFAFKDIFSEAQKFGVQTSYVTEKIDQEKIKELVPDFAERSFYISGPYGFVHAMENNLIALGLPLKQIKTDYFPGYGS